MDLVHSMFTVSNIKYSVMDDYICYKIKSMNIVTKIKYEISDLEIKLMSYDGDFMSAHIIRIITHKSMNVFNIEISYDVFQLIFDILDNPYVFCTVCANNISYSGEDYKSCDSCFLKMCQIVTDNIICDSIKKDKMAVYFIIKTALYDHNLWPNMENIRDLVKMHQLEEIIDKYSEIQIDSDLSLFDKIGNELYGFVKYVILTNKTDIVFEKINSSLYEYIDTDLHLDNNSLINFHVHHSDSVEAKFNSDPDPYYVYHGTLCKNWYSIMQHGLKNYSGTAMMKNGAAYGPGIYLAQNPELAFRYSAFNKDNKKIKDDMIIIGVVQILDRHKYDKKNGIYVVPDEDNVLLKYLILLNKKDIPLIKPYYDKITKEIQTTASLIDSIMEKRLLNEFKKATKIPNVIISLSGSNNMEWNIMITDIIFKFYFSKQYPLIPPVIKVIYDANNVNITKILNHENIVLMKELDKNHWNIRNNVCQIIKLLDKKIKI